MAEFTWIDVKDALPTKTGSYLVTIYGSIKNRVEIDFYIALDGGAWETTIKKKYLLGQKFPKPTKQLNREEK